MAFLAIRYVYYTFGLHGGFKLWMHAVRGVNMRDRKSVV